MRSRFGAKAGIWPVVFTFICMWMAVVGSVAHGQTTPVREDYYDTSLTACPAGRTVLYFWYYQDIPGRRGGDWCGAASASLAYDNAGPVQPWNRPIWLVDCVAGEYWTYAHGKVNDPNFVYYSPRYRGINMACEVQPVPPPFIELMGDSSTKVLPAGPELPLIARITQNGAPLSSTPLSITVTRADNTTVAFSGITDGQGEYKFRYIPPVQKPGTDLISATCSNCSNTAQKPIVAEPCDPCGVRANPISTASGEKLQSEADWADAAAHPLSLTRHYRSFGAPPAGMGTHWSHDYAPVLAAGSLNATVKLGDGSKVVFRRPNTSSAWVADNGRDSLADTASGPQYTRASDETRFQFDGSGRLLNITQRNGWAYTLTYNGSQLQQVTNAFGRSLQFNYTAGLLTSVTTPDSQSIAYGYDTAGRLQTVTYPGGATRSYHYEDGSHPQALTGITDESNVRYASFGYDAQGRAISSTHAGNAQNYGVVYPNAAPSTLSSGSVGTSTYQVTAQVSDPAGGNQLLTFLGGDGQVRLQQSNGAFEGEQVASRSFTTGMLPETETDFLGVQTMYTWDINRRLPTSTTLAANRPEARTIQTQWHPTFRLPTLITEPGRTTGFTYDSLGNVLTTTVTDTATGQSRTVTLAYNAQGLLQSLTDPLGGVTQFGYDTVGNLTSETNTLGHVTSFTHDAAGRVLTQTHPTGLVTSYTYDARGRVLTVSAAGQTTTFTYQPTGNLATATFASGLAITYSYDAAQRMTGWSSNRGAQGSYTLDASGNRTAEQVKDANGNVIWQLARSINAMNWVTGTTLGANLSQSFAYNANGDLTSHTNGLNQSTSHTLDGLKRVTAITNAANATASLAYDARDNLTSATDFKGVTTTYSRNAFGEAQQEASSDPGTNATAYNALGLPTQVTDAMGQATSIQRDALGRPTQMDFQDGKTTILRYDLTGGDYNAPGAPNASKGYLSEIEDRAGTTKWQRDVQGRVTQRTQTLKNGSTQTVGYTYNAQGLLDTLTYPGGGQLQHLYDATGRLSGMNWNGSPLISNITWDALNQPTGWSWAFSTPLTASRSYDTAGRLTATEISSYSYDAAGRITSLTQNLGQPADSDPNSTSVTFANTTFTAGYDAVGRITSFGDGTSSTTFTYDANGNRESSITSGNGTTVTRSYTVDAASNRLTGFTQQITGPGGNSATSVTYTYNANGDITSDGLRNFSFDAEGRLSSVATGSTQTSPTTRYAHSAMGERLFKTEPLQIGEEPQPGQEQNFIEQLFSFFKKLWAPQTTTAEQLGWAYAYGEGGTLLAEVGMGGASSTGATQFVWLPAPGGAVPVAAIINGSTYAVHADHLNTPRRLTDQYGQAAWQWKFSAFGEEQPTRAAKRFVDPDKVPGMGSGAVADVTYNLRYPGQVADAESGLHYNYFRTYDPNTARYLQPDPIGLSGDWNRYLYAGGSATNETDPTGLIRSSVEAACMKDPSFCMEIMGEMAGNAGEASRRAGDDCAAEAFEQIAGALSTAGAIFEFAGMRGLGKGMARSAAKGPGKRTAGGAGDGAGPGKNFGGRVEEGAGAAGRSGAVETGTTTVQRWMSKAELEATQKSGILRGGRDGTHHVTDAANSDALRARQRLALPQTPEVRVTMEVPKDALSPPSKVEPAFNMRGGGMERTATGRVPVKILKVD